MTAHWCEHRRKSLNLPPQGPQANPVARPLLGWTHSPTFPLVLLGPKTHLDPALPSLTSAPLCEAGICPIRRNSLPSAFTEQWLPQGI